MPVYSMQEILIVLVSLYLKKKLNSLVLTNHLFTIHYRSITNYCIEVECACPPFELHKRHLDGKLILKNVSNPKSSHWTLICLTHGNTYRNLFLSSPSSLFHSLPFNLLYINNFLTCKSSTLHFQHLSLNHLLQYLLTVSAMYLKICYYFLNLMSIFSLITSSLPILIIIF